MAFSRGSRIWFISATMVASSLVSASLVLADKRQKQKVVGLGATTCAGFMTDAVRKPSVQREYLAWVQGYMSAILLTRPGTVDDGLDLAPPTFPLLKQLEFLRNECTAHPTESFPDAVENLYKTLRKELAA